jgi:hypothetical protein
MEKPDESSRVRARLLDVGEYEIKGSMETLESSREGERGCNLTVVHSEHKDGGYYHKRPHQVWYKSMSHKPEFGDLLTIEDGCWSHGYQVYSTKYNEKDVVISVKIRSVDGKKKKRKMRLNRTGTWAVEGKRKYEVVEWGVATCMWWTGY